MDTMEKNDTFSLPNRKVKVLPIIRRSSWLGKGHDGEFMFTGTSMPLSIPRNGQTGQLMNPLTDDEALFLEKKLAKKEGDLSIYKAPKENFWSRYYVKLDKDETLLDLSDPDQYIRYKVLLTNKELIAPSFEDRLNIPSARWMMVDVDHEVATEAREAELMQSVWMEFGAIQNSHNKMRNVLKIYSEKSVPKNAKTDFLKAEVKKVVELNPNKFIQIIKDDNFDMRCFIEDALEVGAIAKTGKNKYAIAGEPDDVYSITQIITELDPNGINSDMYMKIKSQIEGSK
jgi:hypothetical protein